MALARLLVVSALFVSSVCGCAARQGSSARCTGGEQLHCLTPVTCTPDRARGCDVCHCSDTPYTPIQR